MSQLTVNTVFAAVDKFTKPLKAMEQSTMSFAQKATAATAMAERGFKKLTSPLQKLNQMLGGFGLALGGALIIGAVGNAISIFKDFEQANANLKSVLGATDEQMKLLTNSSKTLGATTAFSSSQVAGLQTEFARLGFSTQEILGATEATLSLAAATNTDLAQSAKQVGAAIRAFGLDASEAQRIADVFAASTSKSALNMEFLDVAMSKVAPVAKQFNFSVEDATSLLGKLADAGFDASTAATSTRSILLNLADSNGKLAKALGKPVKTLPELVDGMKNLSSKGIDLAKMLNLTDKQSVAAFATFMANADAVGKLNDELKGAGGTAENMAKTQLNTLNGSITMLQSAYEGFILSIEDGNGVLGHKIRRVIEVTTEILSLASGTATATEKLDEQGKKTREYAELAIRAIKVVGWLVGAFVAFKAILIATKTIMGVVKAVQYGILIATKLWTAAQWLLNAALTANPIGLIIVAIAALIALVIAIIYYWDEWGRALIAFSGPIGMIINLFQELYENWDMIKKAFEMDGILAGFKALGKVILSGLLYPLQKVLEIIGYLPDWLGGGLATDGAKKIGDIRADLTAFEEYQPKPEVINMNNERTRNFVETINNNERQQLDVNFNNVPNGTTVQSSGANFVMPKLTPSFNF